VVKVATGCQQPLAAGRKIGSGGFFLGIWNEGKNLPTHFPCALTSATGRYSFAIPYFLKISFTFSIGIASAVCPLPLTVVAWKSEL
jgi:hypothetical protein